MRKFLTSLAAISLIGGLFIAAPARVAAAGAGTVDVSSSDGDIIHNDVSRESDGERQTYLAPAGSTLAMEVLVIEAGDDQDLDDYITFSLKNGTFSGAYNDDNGYPAYDDGDLNEDACNLNWTDTNKAAAGTATIIADIDCNAGTGADGAPDHTVTLYFSVTIPAGGSSVLTIDSAAADVKVFFFAAEAADNIYVGSGNLPATAGDGNCTNPDFSTTAAAQGSIMEALFAAFAGVDEDTDTVILCDGTYTYNADFEEYEGNDLYDGTIHLAGYSANGATLDGDGAYQIIRVDDVDLDVDGINFFDGQASGSGGAIYVNDGDLEIDNSTFDENDSDDFGGAVAVPDGEVVVDNSEFTENHADEDGGALYARYYDVTIANSEFVDNDADDQGGAVAVRNDDDTSVTYFSIDGSTFEDNYADDDGGSVFSAHNVMLSVDDTSFSANYSDEDGGAILAKDDATIGFSTFEDNETYYEGGSIFFDEMAHIHDSTFARNSTYDDDGGAVYAETQLRLEDSIFRLNSTEDDGGAVYIEGVSDISGSVFFRNTAASEGGAVFADDDSTVTGSRFVRNTSVSWAGALSLAETGTVNTTVFRSNHSRKGGAIDSWGDRLYLSQSKFINNYASLWGGAIARTANYGSGTQLGDVDATTIFRANRTRVGGPVALYNWDQDRVVARQSARFWEAAGAHTYIVR